MLQPTIRRYLSKRVRSEATASEPTSHGIHEIRLSDGAQREITSQKWQHVGDKSWLPDGSGLIVSARDLKTHVKQIWFVAYPSGEARPLSNDHDNFSHVSLTADSRMLAAEQFNLVSDIWSAPLADVASGKKVGVWGSEGLCLVPDGRIVYSGLLSEAADELWIMYADGTERNHTDIQLLTELDGCQESQEVGRTAVYKHSTPTEWSACTAAIDGVDYSSPVRTKYLCLRPYRA